MSGTQWAEPQAGPQRGSGGKCGRAGARAAGRGRASSAAARGTAFHVARLAEEAVVEGVAALVRGLH